MPSAWARFLPGVSGSLDIKYCSSSNSGSSGRDGELMQQGSGWPAGGDISRSKPASSKPTATAEGAPRGAALLGACGGMSWEEQPHPCPVDWGQDPSGGEVGTEEERGEAGSWLSLTQT